MRKYLQCNVDTRYLNRKGSEKLCETPMWVHFGSFVNRLYFVTFSGSKSPICTNHTFFHSFQTCNLIGRSNTDSFDGARRWQDGNWNFVQKKKVEYLRRTSVCAGKCSFDPCVPFHFHLMQTLTCWIWGTLSSGGLANKEFQWTGLRLCS